MFLDISGIISSSCGGPKDNMFDRSQTSKPQKSISEVLVFLSSTSEFEYITVNPAFPLRS